MQPTPKQAVPQTPVPQLVQPTPKQVVPQTPVPQLVQPTPKQAVPQTPVQQLVQPSPKQGVLQSGNNRDELIDENESNEEMSDNRFDPVKTDKTNYKSLWVKLINRSTCKALCKDVIEGCKDLTEEMIKELCEEYKEKEIITLQDVKIFIEKNLKDKSTDLVTDCVFPQNIFMKVIQEVLDNNNKKIEVDSVYRLQVYTESLLIKILNGAELIKEASKRKRVFATDLLICYQIYKM